MDCRTRGDIYLNEPIGKDKDDNTVVLEGIVLGKAIVTTDCPGMKELLGNSKYGIVCENNEKAISKTIEHILCSPNLQKQYESEIQNQKYNYDIKNSIHQIETLLNDGKLVLFSGTPCQVAGLNACLKKQYENLSKNYF